MSETLALVCDDDEDIRLITTLALSRFAGWTVIQADRAADAIALARDRRPAVILLDVMMPEMDGVEAARRLLADPETAGIPIVLVTAKAVPGQPAPWDDVPVAGVIGKPFDPAALAAQVSALVGW